MNPNLTFWLDVAKTFLGAFLGAGLAFLSNLYIQKRQRDRANVAAANLALTVLMLQLSDFLNVRKAFLDWREKQHGDKPTAPLWMHFRPLSYPYSEGLTFDLSSIAFLFEHKEAEAVAKLAMAERRYRDLVGLHEQHNEAQIEIQKRMEFFPVPDSGDVDVEEAEKHLGKRLVANGNSFASSLLLRFEKDEQDYMSGVAALRAAVAKIYGSEAIVNVTPKPEFSTSATKLPAEPA